MNNLPDGWELLPGNLTGAGKSLKGIIGSYGVVKQVFRPYRWVSSYSGCLGLVEVIYISGTVPLDEAARQVEAHVLRHVEAMHKAVTNNTQETA